MLKFYVRQGMVVDKVHDIISFKQSSWLEKYINFNTQKRNQAVNDFEKDFYKLVKIAFYGKTMENVRNRFNIKFFKKDDYREIIKQQSKLTFNGIHKSHEKCYSYTVGQNEVLMDKPIYLGFTVLELVNYQCIRYTTINFNHILDRKIFIYIIWILIALY